MVEQLNAFAGEVTSRWPAQWVPTVNGGRRTVRVLDGKRGRFTANVNFMFYD